MIESSMEYNVAFPLYICLDDGEVMRIEPSTSQRTCLPNLSSSSNHFGCDCSMLETLYQTILHDPSL